MIEFLAELEPPFFSKRKKYMSPTSILVATFVLMLKHAEQAMDEDSESDAPPGMVTPGSSRQSSVKGDDSGDEESDDD